MINNKLKRLSYSAIFLALGMVLPFLTGQIKEIGDSLLPMHLVVMLCSLICGWKYGLVVGLVLPFLRSICFGMPPLYPNAIWMSVELLTYGFATDFIYSHLKKTTPNLLLSLVVSMIFGRASWGLCKWALLGGQKFTFYAFLVGGFTDALPGIIIQLVLIPVIIGLYNKFSKRSFKMKHVVFPYGKECLEYDFNSNELVGVLESSINHYKPDFSESELIENALASPHGASTLDVLARGKKNIVIIASDHTRPVPSKLIIPPMLREIRKASPDAKITILIATGCHRGTTKDELVAKFGKDIVDNESIYIHDCDESDMLVNIGTLPSGGECIINKLAHEADLLLAEGFIEPHFFAGFSGGRKSVLPGVCARKTVLANHCSEFIANPNCRTGILENNPMHLDMLWAAKRANLAFIVNVVLNDKKEVIFATCGDVEMAHRAGTDFLSSLCGVKAIDADIVITTNGGYPLDQNVYQAVKGMTAGEATVKKGGIIIMLAKSNDGIGGAHFYNQLSSESDINKTMELFLSRGRNETVPDQWQTQVMLRVLQHAEVIYISSMDDETIKNMHMTPAHSIEEALKIAKAKLGKNDVKIVAIPDGVSVIVQK